MFSCLRCIQEFFSGKGHSNLLYFQACFFFSGRIILEHIGNKKGSRGIRGMLSRKVFENLHASVAMLELFGQFLGKFCLNFLPLNLSVSAEMMHFVYIFSIMPAQDVRLIVMEKV